MQKLKVCFIGVGSIARRHISNLNTVCAERGISLEIDAFSRSGKNENGLVGHVFNSTEDMPLDYDAVFITNPTEYHLDALKRFHSAGKHFFIEKPVVSLRQLDAAREFETREGSVYYVACPLRYNAVIQYIKGNIDPGEVISVRCISSSYLPDWRPGQDYRKTYSARKEFGGGVSIDLIHEWDYITWLFGKPELVRTLIGRKSDLEIDSDDFALYIAEYADKTVELHLDYYGRKTIREIQLFTKNDTIVGDLVNNRVEYLVSGEKIGFQEQRNDYQRRELDHFLDMILGKVPADNFFAHGIEVLDLTQGRL